MGRQIGSVIQERPFNNALRIALRGDPLGLRRIAEKLTILAEEGDLAAIREFADRLDGKPMQVNYRSYVNCFKFALSIRTCRGSGKWLLPARALAACYKQCSRGPWLRIFPRCTRLVLEIVGTLVATSGHAQPDSGTIQLGRVPAYLPIFR